LGEELGKRGCAVVLADRQVKMAEEVAAKILNSSGKAGAVKVDVTDFDAVERLVQETIERTGRLDYIFNNAGIAIGGKEMGGRGAADISSSKQKVSWNQK
jgi:NAD(P)-dependent dehydrogenase (short-subunit alcohol dehydrogenase family)